MTQLTPKPHGHPIKLVRDKTPQVINSSLQPGDLFYGPYPVQDRIRWLKAKLAEEVTELLIDGGQDELLDVYAVVRGLGEHWGLSLETLEASMLQDERGGFFEGIMMYGYHKEFDGQ